MEEHDRRVLAAVRAVPLVLEASAVNVHELGWHGEWSARPLHALDNDRDALTDADAHRRQSITPAAPLQRVNERHQHAGA